MSAIIIKKICEWIKAIFKRKAPEPDTGRWSELDKKLGRKIQQRQEKMGRPVDTHRGYPNMPRYQFCNCGRQAKRSRKTDGGAYYKCKDHGEFFVRSPGL